MAQAHCYTHSFREYTAERCPNPACVMFTLELWDGTDLSIYVCQHHEFRVERMLTRYVKDALITGFLLTYLDWTPSLS